MRGRSESGNKNRRWSNFKLEPTSLRNLADPNAEWINQYGNHQSQIQEFMKLFSMKNLYFHNGDLFVEQT